MKGKWFAGWGFCHFWETAPERAAPHHTQMVGHDGEGSEATFPGAIKSETFDFPIRDTVLRLGIGTLACRAVH